MGGKTNILILSKQTDRPENLIFLLQLANYLVSHITDDSEAFNYLVQRQQSPSPVNLLLINAVDQQQPLLQMLDELDRSRAMLPILLTYRKIPFALEKLTCREPLKRQIKQCRMDATHTNIREILNSASQQHSGQFGKRFNRQELT